ncbi:MAG TPA: hypothetical protein QF509_02460 [Rhodospirillales bacterium]|nr:hypothetical protein [Rhodospirillales bacterium]
MNGSPRLSRGLGFAALLVAFFLITGLFQEYAVRLAMPQFNPAHHITFVKGQDGLPVLGPRNEVLRQIKNTGDFDVTVRFNRHGLRDSKDMSKGTAEGYFLVGDSYPFGWGVEEEERLSEQLETLIGRRVFNLSTNGDINTYGELIDYARRNGADVRKLLVVLTMENDIRDYDALDAASVRKVEAGRGLELRDVKNYLMANSALYFMATTFIHGTPWLKDLAVKAGLVVPNLAGVHRPVFSDEAIDSTARRLAELGGSYDMTVVLIPSRALWHGGETKRADYVHRSLLGRLGELNVDTLDLRAAFEVGGKPLGLHFLNDGHWRPAGHRRAAETIAAHLQRRPPQAAH